MIKTIAKPKRSNNPEISPETAAISNNKWLNFNLVVKNETGNHIATIAHINKA